jgi:EmrB/QacA subfamily drug resistance transporter
LFATGLAIFTLGSLLCGIAQEPWQLIAFRAAQGLGGATIFATSLALLAQTFHGKERGMAFGIWGAVAGVSTAIGPVLGGLLTSGLNWRWIFFVNLPVGIFAIAVTLYRLEESRIPQARRPDVPGAIVFTLGLFALVYGLIEAGHDGWGGSTVIATLVAGVVLIAAFIVLESRVAHPMFDLSLFRKPTFVGGSIAALAMNGSLFAMFLYIILYLQNGLHYSPLQSGLRLLVVTGATLFTAIPAGRLSSHLPVRWLIGPGLVIVGAGLLLMHGVSVGSSWTHLIPGFVIAGLGSGLVNPPLASTAVGVVEPKDAGMASGINTTFRQVGIATSVAVLGSILSRKTGSPGSGGSPAAFVDALNELFLIAGVIAIAGGVLACFLIRQKDFAAAHGGRQEAAPAAH